MRLRVRCRRTAIDHQIARGTPPSTSVMLALRAQQLASRADRRVIAAGLENILAAAAEAQLDPASRLVVDHVAVSTARPEIITLIQRLRDDEATHVRGIALSRVLTFGPRSPLLCPGADPTLVQALAEIFEAL